ncbi:LOW QUALITY PROTEIN: tripartite motif-containing protein 66 [Thalassophryne amazonica]|uniref:LOW QUALITY PROTEIN: tripartite motif-containing protein 66 n=1 Tax=Thalassophryne amazonica TaxID=390379 RepID=UPI001470F9AE|nr:LOW QUALITY PROTEIN: tripartite motif-containing protein 66 [Thalassophryne amazonica]
MLSSCCEGGTTLKGIEMEKSCSECSELAQSLCTLCNKWLCYQCTDVHQHQKAPTTSQYNNVHQQPRPSASQCPDVHQKGSSSLPPTEEGPGPYPCSHLMCHSHRQEPLELFCESCDLLCCSSCHLSSHKNHRVVQIGKALQDQQWLLENLMVQVEDRRSAVENNAKQTEDRLHGVKIAQRKAENQIKMAKMIMMNELNKRANLLIEQLEKISEDFEQRLEDQLQGAIEICRQLDHVQKFITWAMSHHCRNPVLFSKAMISHQMQQLFEPSPHLGSWSPVKIKFNWDASYWTKQISSFGQLTVEGGNRTYPQGLSFPSILRPQPISCLALPSVCYRGRDPSCGYQACCEPQMCCLHGIPNQPDLPVLDKQHVEPNFYNSSCVQPTLISASLPENQHLQRCCGPESSSSFQSSSQCPSVSSSQTMGSLQLNCSRAPSSPLQAAASQPQPKSYFYHQHQREFLLGSQAQPSAEHGILGQGQVHVQCQEKILTSPPVDRNGMLEEEWEERRRGGETNSQTAVVESRKIVDGELQQDRREQPAVQQLQDQSQVSTEAEQQRTGETLMLKDHRDGRSQSPLPGVMDQRSSSLELSVTVSQCGSDVQSSRLSPKSACARRKKRSQSIPPELADPSTSRCTERPTECTHSLEAGPADKCDVAVGPRWRGSSDGVLCITKKPLSDTDPITAHKIKQSSALSYKMEPDHCPTYANEDTECEAKEKCKMSENTHNSQEAQMSLAKSRVPVVCLERLKILVSQLPPHGQRQSDPLPTSGTENSETATQQKMWHDTTNQDTAGSSETIRIAHSLTAPQYVERQSCDPSFTAHSANTDFDCRRLCSAAEVTVPSTNSTYVPPSTSPLDLDSDSDHRTISNVAAISQGDPDFGQRLDSYPSIESDPHADSSSEAEPECLTQDKSADITKTGLCGEPAVVDSESSCDYEADSKLDAGADLLFTQQLGGEAESADVETESDLQPEYDEIFQTELDSDIVSDPPPDSPGSVELEPDRESESEVITDDPQPLCSDQEEETHTGHGHRPILIANLVLPQKGCEEMEEVQLDQDEADMDSEDFCAVCLIGGDLLCCDRCPKVFHLSCHVPSLLSFPSGDWICSLCRDVMQPEVEYDCENKTSVGQASACGLSACDQRKCEKLTLLILSNMLSAPFHEPVSPLARHYYQIIKKPMDLSVIRAKLNKRCSQHYHSPEQFVADVYLMFHNCAKFNYPDSEVAQAGRSLGDFFTSKLKCVFPDRVFPTTEPDSDSDEYDEAYRTADGGFPWPERREQCHRKRKRRNSLKSRRHHF